LIKESDYVTSIPEVSPFCLDGHQNGSCEINFAEIIAACLH
jgi:hypothetical protein